MKTRAILVSAANLLLGASLSAQAHTVAGETAGLERHDFAVLAVSAHPWSTIVAVTVAIPHGSAADPRELSGAAWLLGEQVRDLAEERVAATGATVTVEVDRAYTVFQALTVPSEWRGVYDALMEAVFSVELAAPSLQRHRSELLEVFRFESGAPVREFQAELYRFVADPDETWSRDPRGTTESVLRIGPTDLADLKSQIYRRGDAVVTVVGPFDAAAGVRIFPGPAPANSAGRLGREGSDRPVREDGGREHLEREVTNTWIGAAFPAAAEVPRTILEFLEYRLNEVLNPDPPDPGLFGSEVTLEELPQGPVLLAQTAVLPEAQDRWEERISEALESIREQSEDAGFLRWHRRRFRSFRLTAEGAPEVEGLRMAMDLLREGRVRDLAAEIWGLEPGNMSRGALALAEPRLLVFGPDLGDGGR